MKNILVPIVITALIIATLGYLNIKGVTKAHLPSPTKSSSTLKQMKVGNTSVFVEIANTDFLRQQGLSGRGSLNENSGMLFVFPKSSLPAFWMKGMKFPLDFIWIANSKVVQINKNVEPEPGKTDNELSLYRPEIPIDYVLEVNAGFSDKNSIHVGDKVTLPQ